MAFPLFASPSSTILRLGLGLGLGVSAATLHPLSPFRSPIQCQYSAPYYRPETPANADSGWAVKSNDPLLSKQGRTGIGAQAQSGFLTADNMRQISLGSVLGLVAGVGLRAFSRVLVVVLGMGVVLIEVCFLPLFTFLGSLRGGCHASSRANVGYSGLRQRDTMSSRLTGCKGSSRGSIYTGPFTSIGHSS